MEESEAGSVGQAGQEKNKCIQVSQIEAERELAHQHKDSAPH